MIEIERLEKTFTQPGGERVPALRGIDVVINTGEFVTVIGTNGSGKSTLLNAVAGSFLLIRARFGSQASMSPASLSSSVRR